MKLDRDGAELVPRALDEAALRAVGEALSGLPAERPGVRIHGCPALRPLLSRDGPIGRIAARFLGPDCRAVRAILFDKLETANWALAWHQDRTIAVAERSKTPGFSRWNRKDGIDHVEPPVELLERMVTLRAHLDDVDEDNAPLLVALGSHRLGRVREDNLADVVQRCGARACLAQRGDVWVYATLVLHASEAARRPRSRRVLQVDYSADSLPGGLRFHEV